LLCIGFYIFAQEWIGLVSAAKSEINTLFTEKFRYLDEELEEIFYDSDNNKIVNEEPDVFDSKKPVYSLFKEGCSFFLE
jgi:hypothetical protein